MTTALQFPAQITGGATPALIECKLVNRTGAALAEGDLVSLNLDFAATSGQAMVGLDPSDTSDSATGYILGAAITCTAENCLRASFVAREAIADNAFGKFAASGVVKLKMNTTNGYLLSNHNNDGTISATATAAIGYQNQAALDAASKQINIIGICLETTSTTGKALFQGGLLPYLTGGGG